MPDLPFKLILLKQRPPFITLQMPRHHQARAFVMPPQMGRRSGHHRILLKIDRSVPQQLQVRAVQDRHPQLDPLPRPQVQRAPIRSGPALPRPREAADGGVPRAALRHQPRADRPQPGRGHDNRRDFSVPAARQTDPA